MLGAGGCPVHCMMLTTFLACTHQMPVAVPCPLRQLKVSQTLPNIFLPQLKIIAERSCASAFSLFQNEVNIVPLSNKGIVALKLLPIEKYMRSLIYI